MQHFQVIQTALINGEWIDSKNKLDVINPATKQKIGSIPNLGVKETQQAIDAAAEAFPIWSKTPPATRANILLKWHNLILQHKSQLAALLSMEGGKALEESRGEIEYGAAFVRWFAEGCRRVDGDIIPSDNPEKRYLVIKQPVGVVGAITPWNFPNAMITRKCAPALAAGCTVVLKPSELTPFSALALAELALEAGIPKGVFNIVTGDAESIGNTLCEDPRVRKISFTGSTRVGQLLMAQCAPTLKRLSLELGGNAPFIVFEDANLDKAVKDLIASRFRNNGQTCVCANRILVQESIFETFLSKLVDAVKKLKVGLAFKDESVQLGPLINQEHLDKMQRLVQDALDKGAECVLGGKPLDMGGYFFEPTILTQLNPTMQISFEEIFGPILALYPFRTEEEALQIANATHAGLASYVFTENMPRLWRMMENLEYGMVGANTGSMSNAITPFGGVKHSGFGREGSKYGIDEYIQLKYLCLDVS